jgi:pyridoxal phosphate enzyme (YggS family)
MLAQTLNETLQRIKNAANAANRPIPRLLAVSKLQPVAAIAELAAAGQCAFGENYVQEGQGKARELAALGLAWHLIGHLQSNKAEAAATVFDWVQTVDRAKLIPALARYRPVQREPLNVLIQVNIDDETGKHGCHPDEIEPLAAAIAATPRLNLRGLMAIPTPHADIEQRRPAFRHLRECFEALAKRYSSVDTLSMGMSDDFTIAIEEGSTMLRIGTALFGKRG